MGCRDRVLRLPETVRIGNPLKSPALLILLVMITATVSAGMAQSVCYGTPSNGALENGCKLPTKGGNFQTYSLLGTAIGRTYVHCQVEDVVLAAYEDLEETRPEATFVYGETGWASGGRFKPHRTHQNGLSVDFMVPVRDAEGRSIPLPTHPFNKYGYGVEFDAQGRSGTLSLDFEALTQHLLALHQAAQAQGVGIQRVIFDPALQPHLRKTKAWPTLENEVRFSKRRSWVRHDDHYHVDFEVSCQPMQ